MYLLMIRLSKILFLTFFTILLSISCSISQILKCTRVIDGDTIVLNNGEIVRLELDQQRKGKYDRTLAHVYLMNDTFLKAEIVKQSYGHAYTKFPFKDIDQFRQYEKEARENKRGLWAAKSTDEDKKLILEKYVGAKNSNIYHRPTCIAAQKIKSSNRRVFYSVKKAVDAGYMPCNMCRPPYYK